VLFGLPLTEPSWVLLSRTPSRRGISPATDGVGVLNPQMAKVVATQVATPPAGLVVRKFLAKVGGKAQKSGPGLNTSC
jgi:hypothetical protein